jgi:hypothetical protein
MFEFDLILGYASVALIAASALFTWRAYQLTKSKPIMWLFIAFVYTTIIRWVIVAYNPPHINYLLMPFYILLTIGMWAFLQLIKKYINHDSKCGLLNKIKHWIGLK